MNRTQAKARAAELGISKEEARTFGNLSKTQTWLDAIAAQASGGIAAHEAALQSVTEAEEETFPAELQPSPIVAEASVPMFPDPWDEPEAPVEPAMNRWSSESIEPLDDEAAPASIRRPVPAKQDSEAAKASPDASALVYPLLLFGIAVWAAYQLLVGLGSLMSLGLHHVAKQSIPATRVRVEEQQVSMPQPASRRSTRSLSRAIQPAQLQPEG